VQRVPFGQPISLINYLTTCMCGVSAAENSAPKRSESVSVGDIF